MERSRGGVCRHGGSFPIAFRCAAISWFKLTHSQALHELHVQGLNVSCDPFPMRWHQITKSTAGRRAARVRYRMVDVDAIMRPVRYASLQALSNPSHPCRPYRRPAWPESPNPSSAFRQPSLPLSPGGQQPNSRPVGRPSRPWPGR